MRRSGLCTFLLPLLAALSDPAAAQDSKQPVSIVGPRLNCRVGIDRDLPPYTYVGPDGVSRGFAVDLIRAIAETEELEVVFVPGTWSEIVAALEHGEIDVIANMPGATAGEDRFDLTLPHTQVDDAIFIRTGTQGLVTEENLAGKRVAVMADDPAYEALRVDGKVGQLLAEPSVAAALRRLAAGEADAAVVPQATGQRLARELKLANVTFSRAMDSYRRSFSFAVAKGSSPLMRKLEEGLSIITADGRFNRLYDSWLTGVDPEQERQRERQRKLLWLVGLTLVVVVVLSTAWLGSLRRTVARRTAELQREVVERRRAEEALAVSEKKYRGLFNSSIDAIALFDLRRRIADANPAFTKMLEIEIEELRDPSADKLSGERLSEIERRIFDEEVIEQGSPHESEKELLRKSGAPVPVNVRLWPVEDEAGKLAGVWCLMRDLSDRKEAERQRKQLEAQMLQTQKLESLGVLAGGIAHDFNNLLMGILGNVGLARLDLDPASPAYLRLRDIENAGQRAADLCRQMLAYSGKGRFVIELIDLSQLSVDMVHLLEASISKKANLDLELVKNLPRIEADPTQIRQLVMNLLTNASDALDGRDGKITVTTGLLDCDEAYLRNTYLPESLQAGKYVFLEVADTGCGMDAETRARMFDPFFTTKFTGQGLGLAAALGIVRGHRGALKVDSEPGRGTRFRVLFPCTTMMLPMIADPQTVRRAAPIAGEGTVLVVDDEEMVLTVAQRVLKRAGYRVLTATDGRIGVETFRAHAAEILVVLLDMTMPRLNGDEAFRLMRKIKTDARVILTSGYTEKEATRRFADLGLAGFIQKPYPPSALLEKIREVIGSELSVAASSASVA